LRLRAHIFLYEIGLRQWRIDTQLFFFYSPLHRVNCLISQHGGPYGYQIDQ
jgi:hypothetical protein